MRLHVALVGDWHYVRTGVGGQDYAAVLGARCVVRTRGRLVQPMQQFLVVKQAACAARELVARHAFSFSGPKIGFGAPQANPAMSSLFSSQPVSDAFLLG